VFALLGRAGALRSHVNHDPGTHNFERENREVLYRMIGDHFYPGDRTYSATEIACKDELRSMEELYVELPKENASFHTLARDLARSLPREATTVQRRKELARVVRQADWEVQAKEVARTTERGTTAVLWRLQVGKSWSVPVVELTRGTAGEKTAILINDGGRKADPVHAERLLKAGYRVLAMDPFYFGEARVAQKDWLFALLIATVGERPLGVQSSQLAAVARWAAKQHGTAGVHLVAVGPRTSVAALVAGALEARAIRELELHGVRASLKEIIAENRTVDQMPELFCFGLLEVADVPQLVALVAPRPVQLRK
jgi:hypothetical protein